MRLSSEADDAVFEQQRHSQIRSQMNEKRSDDIACCHIDPTERQRWNRNIVQHDGFPEILHMYGHKDQGSQDNGQPPAVKQPVQQILDDPPEQNHSNIRELVPKGSELLVSPM